MGEDSVTSSLGAFVNIYQDVRCHLSVDKPHKWHAYYLTSRFWTLW